MATPFLFDNTWLQRQKFESAEAFYQQLVAGKSGDQTSVKTGTSQSSLKSEIAQARKNIQNVLKDETGGAAGPAGSGDVVARIQNLEAENKQLRQVAQDLQSLVKKLDSRITVLEKGGAASSPAKPTTTASPAKLTPAADDDDDDDEIDLFGDDDDEEEDPEESEERKKLLAAYNEKKSKKKQVIAKSSLLIDVKPWDDETDLKEMENSVRSIEMDGLLWGQSKILPIAYSLKKLQINCVVEDDKVSTEELQEKIEEFEDYVQSTDIVAFNKI